MKLVAILTSRRTLLIQQKQSTSVRPQGSIQLLTTLQKQWGRRCAVSVVGFGVVACAGGFVHFLTPVEAYNRGRWTSDSIWYYGSAMSPLIPFSMALFSCTKAYKCHRLLRCKCFSPPVSLMAPEWLRNPRHEWFQISQKRTPMKRVWTSEIL